MKRGPGHDIVVIGGSAGAIEALREIAGGLPPDLPAAVFVVVHTSPSSRSILPEILARSGALPSAHACDGEPIQPGTIRVAPPDHHLMLEEDHLVVARGPHHNRHRPAVDPLFHSAALHHGPRVVGVVVSGNLDDGTAGLASIERRGGVAIVQKPETCTFPGMPESALRSVPVDHTLTTIEIARAIGRLACEEVKDTVQGDDDRLQRTVARFYGKHVPMEQWGTPSVFACPECHGTLWESDESGVLQFACRVGHSYSVESLLSDHDGSLEATLWASVRALEENAALRRRIADRFRPRHPRLAEAAQERARASEEHAARLRGVLGIDRQGGPTEPEPTP